jgi:hypothetical protein
LQQIWTLRRFSGPAYALNRGTLRLRHAAALGVCAVAALLTANGVAHAQMRFDSEGNLILSKPQRSSSAPLFGLAQPAPHGVTATTPREGRKPLPRIAFPKLPEPKGDALERSRTQWSYADLLNAQANCLTVAKRHDVKFTPLDPIKRGACGDPQPVALESVGKRQPVVFDPPATVNCGMVAALAAWVREDLQRLAKKHLGARVTKVRVMSDYSCRNVYGRRNARLSQHAKANALDIRGFEFSDGSEVNLLSHWGPTRRQLRAYALRKQKQDQKAAEKAGKPAPTPSDKPAGDETEQEPSVAAAPANSQVRGTVAEDDGGASERRSSTPRLTFSFGATGLKRIDPSAAFKLGGPKSKANSKTKTASRKLFSSVDISKRRFLKAAFNSACQRFGTVLGPEFDNTHRNHFHVDLTERRKRNFCR